MTQEIAQCEIHNFALLKRRREQIAKQLDVVSDNTVLELAEDYRIQKAYWEKHGEKNIMSKLLEWLEEKLPDCMRSDTSVIRQAINICKNMPKAAEANHIHSRVFKILKSRADKKQRVGKTLRR